MIDVQKNEFVPRLPVTVTVTVVMELQRLGPFGEKVQGH